jgi:hypothetical protein
MILVIMPKYACNLCGFESDRVSNYQKHLESAKHKANLVKVYPCKYCNREFGTSQSKWNHEKSYCKERRNKEDPKDKIVETLLKKVDDMEKRLDAKDKIIMSQLESKDKLLMEQAEIIKCSNKNAGKSMNTLAYVVKHYNKAPAMKKLTDKNAIKLLEYKGKELTSEEMMIHRYRNGTLDAYLGDIITNAFLDADSPAKQSMWTSDVARLCFVIMYPISKGRREWIADKSGIKITELIIEPLLKNARDMLLAYIKESGKLHDGNKVIDKKLDDDSYSDEDDSDLDDSTDDFNSESDEDNRPKKVKYDKSRQFDQSLVHNMQTAHDIRMMIDNKTLHENVLKHICPFFKLNISI